MKTQVYNGSNILKIRFDLNRSTHRYRMNIKCKKVNAGTLKEQKQYL